MFVVRRAERHTELADVRRDVEKDEPWLPLERERVAGRARGRPDRRPDRNAKEHRRRTPERRSCRMPAYARAAGCRRAGLVVAVGEHRNGRFTFRGRRKSTAADAAVQRARLISFPPLAPRSPAGDVVRMDQSEGMMPKRS